MASHSVPPLGVAGAWGATEIELHRHFDELHQLIYRRGGLGSSNAAVDEVAKLLLVRLWAARRGRSVTDPARAFAEALDDPSLMARDISGRPHPVWPRDEPFRLTNPEVLAAADTIATVIVGSRPDFDALGTAFDALLAGRYDHTGGLGTYLTPSSVARMMADVAIPLVTTEPESISGPGFGDPYCGTGRFLMAMLAAVPPDHPLASAGPFGADVSRSAIAKARTNLLLAGVEKPLAWTVEDSVTDSTMDTLVGRVPLILTNPPFGEGQYDSTDGIARTAAVLPSLRGRSRLDPSVACLARALTLLSPGGVLGIILPDGVLASAPVEELLLGGPNVTLLAVVSLPPATFALSGTVARTSAVFLRSEDPALARGARRDERQRGRSATVGGSVEEGTPVNTASSHTANRRVVLARVDHVGFVSRAGRAVLDPAGNQLPAVGPAITDALTAPRAGNGLPEVLCEAPLVAVVDLGTAATLDPARLDPSAVGARQTILDAGGISLGELITAVPARRCREATRPYVSVLHIDDLGAVDWRAARDYAPRTPGVLAQPGDLIVSLLNPAHLRATVIPPGAPVQVSAEFGVFRSTVDPYAVLALLYAPQVRAQLRPLGTGTSSSRRRIGPADVLSLTVPKLDQSIMDDLAATVRAAQQELTAARDRLQVVYDGAPVDPA